MTMNGFHNLEKKLLQFVNKERKGEGIGKQEKYVQVVWSSKEEGKDITRCQPSHLSEISRHLLQAQMAALVF